MPNAEADSACYSAWLMTRATQGNYYGSLKSNNNKTEAWKSTKWLWSRFIYIVFSSSRLHCMRWTSSIFSNETRGGSWTWSVTVKQGSAVYHSMLSAGCFMSDATLHTCLTLSPLIFTTLWWGRDIHICPHCMTEERNWCQGQVAELRTETTSGAKSNARSTTLPSHLSIAVSRELINGSVGGGCQTPWHLLSQSGRRTCSGLTSKHILPDYACAFLFSTQMYSLEGLIIVTSIFL